MYPSNTMGDSSITSANNKSNGEIGSKGFCYNILFIMTGSIACYKCCQIISKFNQEGHHIQVVATQSALKFVGESTLEGLSGRPVEKDLYHTGNIMDHIQLMRWAHIIVIAPATANFINKIAQGLGDDLASTMLLAHDYLKPLIIAPAMNSTMYNNPITQSSLKKLEKLGAHVLATETGKLACGEFGEGKLLDPDTIYCHIKNEMLNFNSNKSSLNQKILITAGGTKIPIDDVRYIGNLSTGKTGVDLADQLTQFGYDVTLLRSKTSPPPQFVKTNLFFETFEDLDRELKLELHQKNYTHIIHLAAVSDFMIDRIDLNGTYWVGSKLPSGNSLTLKMKSTFKIVDQLQEYSQNKNIQIIAFKLTSGGTPELIQDKIQDLFNHSRANWVVHNDLSKIDLDRQFHYFTLYCNQSDGHSGVVCRSENVKNLAENLKKFVFTDEPQELDKEGEKL